MRRWKQLRALFSREQLDQDLDDEVRAHLDFAADDYIQRGHAPEEARRLARVKFGAVESSKDAHRDARGMNWLEGLLYDLRHAVRGLARDRSFTVAVIVLLALAMGLNVTAFRVMDVMLLRGFPLVKQNDRMVFIEETFPTPGCCVSYMDYEVWKAQAHSFQDLGFYVPKQVSLGETKERARDIFVPFTTSNSFRILGVQPILGRDFQTHDEVSGAEPVVIVSHKYWITRLGGIANVIGHRVFLNNAPATIVGVMPDGFEFLSADAWLPLGETADLHTMVANGGSVYGRLKDGVTEAAARAEIEAISARLEVERPVTNRNVRPRVRNFRDSIAGRNGGIIYGSLWAGAWLVLAIACANLANLALARAQGRTREMCTRMALGSGRGRAIRQLLLESLLLAGVAGVLAWGLASWTIQIWVAATETSGQYRDYSASSGTIAYLAVVSLAVAIVITIAPISRLWRLDVNGALKGESRGSTMSVRAKRFSSALVAGQMALAIVLISGAGVLGRSIEKVLRADVGVQAPETILMGRIPLPSTKYANPESRVRFAESLQARLESTAGVTSAALGSAQPTADFEPRPVEFETQPGVMNGAPVFSSSPGYFRTIGASVLAGRDFGKDDRPMGEQVAIVNQRFAETHFAGKSAIGQRIRLYGKREPGPGEWRRIVGVVSNVMQNDVKRQHFAPVVYVPFSQESAGRVWFFARTRVVSEGMAAAVRNEVRQVDPDLELFEFSTLKDSLGFHMAQNTGYMDLSKHAVVAAIFAGLALLLAAIGLLSVVARSVGQRTREIGVRIALGATSRGIQRLVLWEAMAPVIAGLAVGLLTSLGVNRALQSQLIGVSPYDAPTLIVAPVLLILVALIGSMLPVHQASRVDPAVTLRHE